MRLIGQISLCCLLAASGAMAQRGGGGMRGGGGYGSGMPGGPGAGSVGGVPGGFIGGANFNGARGPIRSALVGFSLPTTPGIAANSVALPFTSVSFPFGLGFPAVPLGFSNGRFPIFRNPSLFNQGFSNWFYGGFGYGIAGIGAYEGYGPVGYPASSGMAMAYLPQPAVQPLSAETAHPVSHEYDQSGQETRRTASAPAAAVPAGRGHLVIREYDQSGQEIAVRVGN